MAAKLKFQSVTFRHGVLGLSGSQCKGFSGSIPTSPTTRSWNDSADGGPCPDWKRRIRQGVNATTSFVGTKISMASTPLTAITYVKQIPSSPDDTSESLAAVQTEIFDRSLIQPPNVDFTSAENKARMYFSKNIERTQTLFNGGVALGELRETLRMIKNPAKLLRSGIDYYLRDVKQIPKKLGRGGISKRLSRVWLEHSFGWLPLLNDLDDARNYLDRRFDQLVQELLPVRGKFQDQIQSGSVFNTGLGLSQVAAHLIQIDSAIVVYAGAVSSRAASPKLINASSMGLSPRNFVPTIWELLPWSFVIDYFTNIGDVLTGWSNQNVALAWGRHTRIGLREWRPGGVYWTNTLPAQYKVYIRSLSSGSLQATARTVTRSPITSAPVPGFQFELPGFGTKWLNLAALARNRQALARWFAL